MSDGRQQQPGPRVLVVDGEQRAALAVVRSLGRAGYAVHVGATAPHALAAASRWVRGTVRAPDPLRASREYVEVIAAYVAKAGIDVVIPVTDASMIALLGAGNRLAPARIPFGSLEAFRRLADKAGLRERAARVGIAFPPQVELAWSERRTMPIDAVPLPVVVKPARSVGDAGGIGLKFGVRHAATAQELRDAIDAFPEAAYPLLLQRRIVGPGVGVFLLLWGGRVVASFAHRRIREKPPSGGVSVCAESIVAAESLVDRSSALLQDVGWCGVAMVEYKIDAATGEAYLMEINGRFWGSLQLAIDAGVDFPSLLVGLALGGSPPARPAYEAGVRSRWWWGDLDHLLARWRHSSRALALPPDAPSRVAALFQILRPYGRRERDAVFRWDDPRPFLLETRQWVRGSRGAAGG